MTRYDGGRQCRPKTRLRPILMNLRSAFHPGASCRWVGELRRPARRWRQSLGHRGVFFGMLGVTFFGLVFTPVFFYVVSTGLSELRFRWRKPESPSRSFKPEIGPDWSLETRHDSITHSCRTRPW